MRKKLTLPAAFLVGFFIALPLFVWYYVRSEAAAEYLGDTVSARASAMVDASLDIARVRVASPWELALEEITVRDKTGAEIAAAPLATVRLSLLGLLRDPVAAVEEIEIAKPRAVLRERADGTWNYADLLKETEEKSSFQGRVKVVDGALTLALADGRQAELNGVELAVATAAAPSYGVDGAAVCRGASVRVHGSFGGAGDTLTVEGENVTVREFAALLPPGKLPENVKLKDGLINRLTADIAVNDGAMEYRGQARLQDGALTALGHELTGLAGTVGLSNDEVNLFLDAKVEGEPASVHGRIEQLAASEPVLKLTVDSPGFELAAVDEQIPVAGPVMLHVDINGPLHKLTASGEAGIARGSVADVPVADLKTVFRYDGARVDIDELKGKVASGKVTASGFLTLADERYAGRVEIDGVDLGLIPQMTAIFPAGISGALTADLGFSGQGQDVTMADVFGNIEFSRGQVEGVAVDRAAASFFRERGNTAIDYASVILGDAHGGGELGIEGNIRADADLDLAIFASRFDLSLLGRFAPAVNIRGYGDLTATLRGGVANPVLAADFAAVNGAVFEQPFRTLKGKAVGNLDGVRVESFSMENGGDPTWTAHGTVGFTGERRIDLTVDTMGERLENIVALVAPDQPLTGNVDNIISITGTLDDPSITGYIHMFRGSYRGYILDGMDGDYTVKDGVVTVQDFHIFSPRLDMDLNGTLNLKTREMKIVADVHDIDLARFDRLLPYLVSGHGKFHGQITGTISDPAFDGSVSAAELNLNDIVVTDVIGQATFRQGQLVLKPVHFAQNGGSYDVKMVIDSRSERVNGDLTVQNGDLYGLLALINAKNDIVQGRLNGRVDLTGSLASPRAQFNAVIPAGSIKGAPVNNVDFIAAYDRRVITVTKFSGRQGSGSFAADGVINLDGGLTGRLTAFGLDAGIIPRLADLNFNMKGNLDIDARLGGTWDRPQAETALTVTSGGVGASAFDAMYADVYYSDGIVQITEATAVKRQGGNDYKLVVDGRVPLAALTGKNDAAAGEGAEMDLQVALANADLSLLPFFSDQVEWALGPTVGQLRLTGTLAAPKIYGVAGFRDGAVKFRFMEKPLAEMNTKLVFAGDTLKIEACHGKLGRGRYELTGYGSYRDGQFEEYHFAAVADRLDVQSDVYKGDLNMNFELVESQDIFGRPRPLLKGEVALRDVELGVPALSDEAMELPNVLLDVNVKIGDKVRLYKAALCDVYFTGDVHFGGSVRHPKNTGVVKVTKGSMYYLQNRFTILHGEAAFNQLDTFLPSVEFYAEDRINRTRIYLTGRGPLGNMAMKLGSSPEMSQTEIMQLLTFRTNVRSGASQADVLTASLLDVGLHMSFLGDLENSVRNVLQLDEFSLSTRDSGFMWAANDYLDRDRQLEYNVRIGKYITPKIMLLFTQGIGNNICRYGARYDFDDRISIALEHDIGRHDVRGNLEYRLKF